MLWILTLALVRLRAGGPALNLINPDLGARGHYVLHDPVRGCSVRAHHDPPFRALLARAVFPVEVGFLLQAGRQLLGGRMIAAPNADPPVLLVEAKLPRCTARAGDLRGVTVVDIDGQAVLRLALGVL